MFVLKIIFISSTILNVSVSSMLCHSDEMVEFICKEPTCSSTIDSGLSVARLRTDSKQPVSIVGYNKDNFLIKKNENVFYVVGKRNIQTNANKFKVNFHKTTFEICDSINKNIENNHPGLSFDKNNKNINKTISKISDTFGSSRVINDTSKKNKKIEQGNENNTNKTDVNVQNADLDKNIDDTVKIVSEDKFNLNTSFNKNLATINSNVENLVNERFSANSDQNTTLESIDSGKTNLSNSLKSINPEQIENYSSTDCTLNLYTNDSNTLQKKTKENIVIVELSDHVQTIQQLPIIGKIENSKENSMNNTIQNSNIISLQNTYISKELNMASSHQQKNDHLQKMKNGSGFDNVLPYSTSITNEIEKQPNYSYDKNESKGNLHEPQNHLQNNLSDVEFITPLSNNKSVDNNTTHSDLLQLTADIVSLTDCPVVYGEVEITELLNKKSNYQCTSKNGYSNPLDLDSILKYGGKNMEHQLRSDINGKSKKSVKSSQPFSKPKDQDPLSRSINTDFEDNIINEITNQYDLEFNFLDHFQNWLFSPPSNSLDFLLHIFGKDFDEYNDLYIDQPVKNQNMFERIKYKNHSKLYFIAAVVITLLFLLVFYTVQATKINCGIKTLNEKLLNESEDIIYHATYLQIEKLEQEVKELVEICREIHTLLSFKLESNAENDEKFNILNVKLANSENLVADLTQKNFHKTKELEKKNDTLKTIQSAIDKLAYKNNSLIKDNAKLSLKLEQMLIKNTLKESRLQNEINNLRFELDKQTYTLLKTENEVSLSKDVSQEVMVHKFNLVKFKKCLPLIKLSAELKSAKQMCDIYKHKLDESSKSNQQYLDHIDNLKISVVNLKNKISKLEKENEESVHKLNILTKFFKEQKKESIHQIDGKTLLCNNKEGKTNDLIEHLKSLNEEITNYKSEIQSLKKEITDQEYSFKVQIYAADKKASNNWLLFKHIENKFKEMERETAQLKNKITMGDKTVENDIKSFDSSKNVEDKLFDIPFPTVYPDFTLLSLIDFEPPPPILTKNDLPPLEGLGHDSSPPVLLSRQHHQPLLLSSPTSTQRPEKYNCMDRHNSLGHSIESVDK